MRLALGLATLATAGCSLLTSLDGLGGSADAGDAAAEATADDSGPEGSADAAADADAATNPYAAAVLADNPVAYYRFEETSGTVAHDSSGHGLDATYGANVTLGVAGLAGGGFAAQFDGTTTGGFEHIVHLAATTSLEPTEISIECWASMASQQTNISLVSYGDDITPPYEPWVLFANAAYPQAYVVAGDAGVGVGSPTALQLQTTHYLATTYDGSMLRLFVDGAQVNAVATTGPIGNYDSVNGLGIGSGGSGTRAAFDGVIDEVAIYDTVLSPQRITLHYAAGL
jgi:hypothetical protein